MSIREKGRLAEEEAAIKRRGQEPSLSYIAVVSGDQQVRSALALGASVAHINSGSRFADSLGDLPIRFRLGHGRFGIRPIGSDRKELLWIVPSGRTFKIGRGALVSDPSIALSPLQSQGDRLTAESRALADEQAACVAYQRLLHKDGYWVECTVS